MTSPFSALILLPRNEGIEQDELNYPPTGTMKGKLILGVRQLCTSLAMKSSQNEPGRKGNCSGSHRNYQSPVYQTPPSQWPGVFVV